MCIAELVAGALMGLIDWRAAFILPGAVSVAIGLWFAAMFRTGIHKAAAAGDTGRPAGGLGDFVRIMIVIGVITVLSGMRSEERRGGKEWVSTSRSRGSP